MICVAILSGFSSAEDNAGSTGAQANDRGGPQKHFDVLSQLAESGIEIPRRDEAAQELNSWIAHRSPQSIQTQSIGLLAQFVAPQSIPQVTREDLSISNMVSKDAATLKARNEYAAQCMAQNSSVPKSGNDLVDMRCSLVAFEVCMNQSTGIISQSQGAKDNCNLIKSVGGPNACQAPCAAAVALPVGGTESVGRYKGLTPAASACYDERMVSASKQPTPSAKACGVNAAVTACLYNGSSLPEVNAAILREAQAGCANFKSRFPNDSCQACVNWQLNHTN